MSDLRYALRVLLKTPGFSIIVVLTLALGVGVNTSVFSMVNVLMFKPPPVQRPEELVWILSSSTKPDGPRGNMTYPDVEDLRSLPVVDGVMAYGEIPANLAHAGRAERLTGQIVTGNYFQVLGIRPHRGRLFAAEDERKPNAEAVISFALWQRVFGARDEAVGTHIFINGAPLTISGIAPRGFRGTDVFSHSDIWIPLGASTLVNADIRAPMARTTWWLRSMARLAPGVSHREAAAALRSRAAAIATAFPESHDGFTVRLSQVGGAPPGDQEQVIPIAGMLMGATLAVLVIACANVANLLLARNLSKTRERAIRTALGASRGHLVRHQLAESAIFAAGGGALGLLLSMWCTDVLLRFAAIPIELDLNPDRRVLLFAIGMSAATGLLFGVLPGIRGTALPPNAALKSEQGFVDASPRSRLPRWLVSGQLALSLVLLLTAGLFLKSITSARTMEVGFQPEGRVSMSFNLRMHGYNAERAIAFEQALIERARTVPGVRSATLAAMVPLGGRVWVSDITFADRTSDPDVRADRASVNFVWPEFFRTLGIPIVAGRPLDEQDMRKVPSTAVISKTMAQRYWPGRDPLGERLSIDGPRGAFLEVVGVAGDIVTDEFNERPWSAVYVPFRDHGDDIALIADAEISSAAAIRLLEAEIHALDTTVAAFQPMTLRQQIDNRMDGERALSRLLSVVGLLALSLAATGLYGVVAYTVARRTREIGVRIALGAQPGDVVRLFLADASRLAIGGLMGGAILAIAVTAVLANTLVGISVTDPSTMVVVLFILSVAILFAAYLPARRATRVDPLTALRTE
jgi:predicted permease